MIQPLRGGLTGNGFDWTTRPRPEWSQDIVERMSCPSFRRSPLVGDDQPSQTAHPSSLAEALGQRPLHLLGVGRIIRARSPKYWTAALNQLMIKFGDRIPV